MAVKILIGGSPCTYWSIAKREGRETEASGMGWELFKNYITAMDKFKPDFFLYENNRSMAESIRNQIDYEFGNRCDTYRTMINSALVSAQQRKRFYWTNFNVERPEDRGIVVNDILEHGMSWTEKSYCLTASYNGAVAWNTLERKQRTMVAESVRVGDIGSTAQAHRVYSPYGKSVNLTANGGGQGAKTGLYFVPIDCTDEHFDGKQIYEVKNGKISVKGKQHNMPLPDGYYMIRKLTPIEAERLQTLPDNYTNGISNAQRYKCVGNGWTAEVIIHILKHALINIPKTEKIIVLSMYDGIATGRYCLDKLGFKNVEYHAYEIDKHAIKIAKKNYDDIIEHGDAFEVLHDDWSIEEQIEKAV